MNKPFVRYQVGDTVRMKKTHPCGSDLWEITRTGIDFGLKCIGCGRRVMLPRAKFEHGVKELFPLGTTPPPLPTRAPAARTRKGPATRLGGARSAGSRPGGARAARPPATEPRDAPSRTSPTRPFALPPSTLPPSKPRAPGVRSGPGPAAPLPPAGSTSPRPLSRPRPLGYRGPSKPPAGPRKP